MTSKTPSNESDLRDDLIALVRKLACAEPTLHDMYDTHLVENTEILPTIVIEEFARRFVAIYESSVTDTTAETRRSAHESVVKIASALEATLSVDNASWRDYIKTLFLENLWHAGDFYGPIKQLLGPLARRALIE